MEVFDTDVLIDIQHRHPPAVAWFNSLQIIPDVPGFVVMELIQSARNKKELQDSQQFVAMLTTVWPSVADCELACRNFSTYHLSHTLGLIDSLIADTAIGFSAKLLTFNTKHFSVVPGLSIAEPYIR